MSTFDPNPVFFDARAVEAYRALAEESSFARAAVTLGMSQSELLHTYNRIERALGVELLVSNANSLEWTPAGRLILAHIQSLHEDWKQTVRKLRQCLNERTGSISIGITPSVACSYIKNMLLEYRREFPGVALEIQQLSPLQVRNALDTRLVDLAFARPGVFVDGVRAATLCEEPMLVAMRKDHPLTSKSVLSLADLEHDRLIGYSAASSPYFENLVTSALSAAHIIVKFDRKSTLPALLGLVEEGIGLGLVPKSATQGWGQRLQFRRLTGPNKIFAETVLFEYETRANPAVCSFIEFIKARCSRIG
ncbi:LysR family transcriptional regulator [Paraburkholderia hospita]|uniref:LysR family transcriptional regulator n=1 Tax=Paraburkholderia hospita TaxID=169430 RepID=A0ABN0FCJ4_9BURK|nr:LysR family transcriptional regulator [Paraburkholderia hospita]EIM96381.1 LysR family transcriptional regulator [Paraburkholderia hospita]OUL70155.1 LysR family transcriptional regulator [Paraburkholderia hospita]